MRPHSSLHNLHGRCVWSDENNKSVSGHSTTPYVEVDSQHVRLKLSSQDGMNTFYFDGAFVVLHIKLSPSKINWPEMKHHWPSLSKLPLPPVDSGLVQILIGMDVVGAHRRLNMQSTDTSISAELHFQTTCLLSNKCPDEPAVGACSVDQSLVATVESLWSTESFGTNLDAKTIMYKEDAQALHTLESTVKDIGNRYEVGLLWKDQDCILPNNKSTALKYFRQ